MKLLIDQVAYDNYADMTAHKVSSRKGRTCFENVGGMCVTRCGTWFGTEGVTLHRSRYEASSKLSLPHRQHDKH